MSSNLYKKMFGKLQDKHSQWPENDDIDEESPINKDKMDSSDEEDEDDHDTHMMIEESGPGSDL